MKHEEKLRQIFDKYKILAIFCLNVKFWEQAAFYVACFTNLIIIVSYSEYFLDSHLPKVSEGY